MKDSVFKYFMFSGVYHMLSNDYLLMAVLNFSASEVKKL